MTVEQLVITIFEQLPNLAIAVLALYWQTQRFDKLLEAQTKLIDKLLQMVDEVREREKVEIVNPVRPPARVDLISGK